MLRRLSLRGKGLGRPRTQNSPAAGLASPVAWRATPTKDQTYSPRACSRRFSVDLLEGFPRNSEWVAPARNTGVDRNLHHHLADLVFGNAVSQRAFDVELQFVGPVEDADHGDVEHAA